MKSSLTKVLFLTCVYALRAFLDHVLRGDWILHNKYGGRGAQNFDVSAFSVSWPEVLANTGRI